RSRLDGVDEHPGGGGFERAIELDAIVQSAETIDVAGDREARHDPGDEPKEVHDRTDVAERDPSSLDAELSDVQSRGDGRVLFGRRVAAVALRQRSHQELAEVTETARTDVL